jgi:hypothetical protein
VLILFQGLSQQATRFVPPSIFDGGDSLIQKIIYRHHTSL